MTAYELNKLECAGRLDYLHVHEWPRDILLRSVFGRQAWAIHQAPWSFVYGLCPEKYHPAIKLEALKQIELNPFRLPFALPLVLQEPKFVTHECSRAA